MLAWHGEATSREAEVDDLRQAVVLARSWHAESAPSASLGWVPELPPAPATTRTWVLEDLDWGRPGLVFGGFTVLVDRELSGAAELQTQGWLATRVRLSVGSQVLGETEGPVTCSSTSCDKDYEPGRGRFGAELEAGHDLVPGPWVLAPGAVFESEHRLPVGVQATLGLAAEIGRRIERLTVLFRAEAPPWLVGTGPVGRIEPLAAEYGLIARRDGLVGWELHAGVEHQVEGHVEPFARAGLRFDLGGSR